MKKPHPPPLYRLSRALNRATALVVIVVVALLLAVTRRRTRLPTHSARGQVNFTAPPVGPPPPPISLTPAGQPPVQQVVIKETVKVNCRYCGQLIDTTAATCPFCGAPRT